jgi:hypothetical protein
MGRKTKYTVKALGIFLLFMGLSFNRVQAHPRENISLQVFYDELSNYGDWINNPQYGYVWRPDVSQNFRPYYTNGHWVMTEYGNTWVSDYEWGWAAFHYGRWFYDDYDGWVWMPDTEWGPAWVSWRTGDGYYGWAPLAPRINININIGRYYVPDNYWVFIPQRCIYYPSYTRYWEPRRNGYIINNTTIINNIYTNRNTRYYTGPGIGDVRRATRNDVPVYRIADDSRPGSSRISRDAVSIYRPDVRKDNSRDAAPRNIASTNSRPSRESDNETISRGNSGDNAYQRPVRSNNENNNDRGIQRPDMSDRSGNHNSGSSSKPDVSNRPERVERSPSPSTSQRPVDRSSSDGTRNNPARPESGRENSRPERVERSQQTPAPRQDTRSESRPQRSEPVSSPRQETPKAESQRENSSSRTESSGGRPSARPGNRGN